MTRTEMLPQGKMPDFDDSECSAVKSPASERILKAAR